MPDARDNFPRERLPPRKEFREFETVVAATPVASDGRVIPAGSTDMIVDVCDTEGFFEVEFLSPFHCVATLSASQIA
jgi:hypothetical protein